MQVEEIARFSEDPDKTVEFYQRLLGTQPAAWAQGETAIFQVGSVRLFFHRKMATHQPGWPLKDEDHVSFSVADVDGTCDELRRRGLAPEVGPQNFYWGRSAYFRDPDGRLVELHQAGTGE